MRCGKVIRVKYIGSLESIIFDGAILADPWVIF